MARTRSPWLTTGVAIAAISLVPISAEAAVYVSSSATKNMTCSGGVCAPTAAYAVLNVNDLAEMLASSNVMVQSGSAAIDIYLVAGLSWTSDSRLTLDAYRSITFQAPLTVAGSGALTFTTNDGGTGGELSFAPTKGSASFWDLGSSLIINGVAYTLVGNIKTLASDIAANPSGDFALAANYDASVDGTYTSSPIPTYFDGTFEGLGNAISNLIITASANKTITGLFSDIGAGTVESLSLINAKVTGRYQAIVGGIAGNNYGTIANVFELGAISGGYISQIGGLAGFNEGFIRSSFTWGTVTANKYGTAGGLVGTSDYGDIVSSHSTAKVSGGIDAFVGGLVGVLSGPLSDSWATGEVTTGDYDGTSSPPNSAGGLVGYYFYYPHGVPAITNCYAIGPVNGGQKTNVGGLIGLTYSINTVSITNSYSIGLVSGGIGSYVGGLIGDLYYQDGNTADTYWDLTTSGVTNPSQGAGNIANEPGITGLTDSQLKSALPTGFDPTIWGQSVKFNNGYPYLLANPQY